MKHIPIRIALICLPALLWGQGGTPISLEEVLDRVQGHNTSIKVSEQQARSARYDHQFSNSVFLPQIAVSHTAMATTNPLMAFGSKLNQGILTPSDFDPTLLNDPDQIQNYATKISVEQPLVNLDGLYHRKAARATLEAKELQVLRTKDHLDFQARVAYGQLQLAHRAVEVMEKAAAAARANEGMAQNAHDQGLLHKADLLAAKVRAAEVENALISAGNRVKDASDRVAFLMAMPMGTVYRPSQGLSPQNPGEMAAIPLENRADVRAMDRVSEAHRANMKAERMTFMPRLNAFASYELYDDEIFRADAKGYILGASLSWEVFKGNQRFAKAGKSRTEYERAKLEYERYVSESGMELERAQRMVQEAQSRLMTSKLAMEQSEESLRIRTDRFQEGLERTTDLLEAEAMYTQKQLEHYQTIFEYNQAQSWLTFLTKE